MTNKGKTENEISKNLENPILEAIKAKDLTVAMNTTPQKKKILPNQIPISLDKFETRLSEKREED